MDDEIPATSMSGGSIDDDPTESMSGLGPEDDAGPTRGARPDPMDRPRRAPSDGPPSVSGPTGPIGGFDQPVLDRPTIDDVAPRRGTPETES